MNKMPDFALQLLEKGILIVTKKSQYEIYVSDNAHPLYTKLVNENDISIQPMLEAHKAHQSTINTIKSVLEKHGFLFEHVDRASMNPSLTMGRLVISIGGDGTALDVSHSIIDGYLLGVNSDTKHSVGFLCAAHEDNFEERLMSFLHGSPATKISRVCTSINGIDVGPPALNEILYADVNPAATTRYIISKVSTLPEEQKSSGVWISSAMGSTGAIYSAGGEVLQHTDDALQLLVREPYFADGPKFSLLRSLLYGDYEKVLIISKMRESKIFIDGSHISVPVEFGDRIEVRSAKPLNMIITQEMIARRQKLVS